MESAFVLKKKRGKNVNSMRVLPPSFYVIDLKTIIRRIWHFYKQIIKFKVYNVIND